MPNLEDFKPGDRWRDSDGDEHTIIGTYKGQVVTYVDEHGLDAWGVAMFDRGKKLPPRPVLRVMYVNLYSDSLPACVHRDRAAADRAASNDRIACVRVEFEENQYDD